MQAFGRNQISVSRFRFSLRKGYALTSRFRRDLRQVSGFGFQNLGFADT